MGQTAATSNLITMLHEAHESKCPPLVMGILNVTPDSFSDGKLYLNPASALARAEQMIRQGAAIIDVGPESTRPGSDPVTPDEQLGRCLPVIRAIHQAHPEVPLSIDTRSASVAAAALDAGACMINDVSALRGDTEMVGLAAGRAVPIVLMHAKGDPKTMQAGGGPDYADVVGEIIEFLRQRVAHAVASGGDERQIVIDPGIGFGKSVENNLEIIRRLGELRQIGRPILFGASRKSFIGTISGGAEPGDRLGGSLACLAAAVTAGAAILRVHDVPESVQAARLTWRIHRA